MKGIGNHIAILTLGLLPSLGVQAREKGEKNVLFIFIDDLRPELGCYGSERAITPNLDRFAEQATVFTRHYVQVPTSGASRCSMLTGMNPVVPGDVSNEAIARRLTGKTETERPESFVHLLRRNGFHTVGIGKVGHSVDGYSYAYGESKSDILEMPYSWDEFLFDSGHWQTGWNAFFGYADGNNRNALQGQVKPYECGKVDDRGYPDGLTADLAVKKIQELANADEPFFLGVGFFKPHLPFNAPEKYWDLYDETQIPLTKYDFIPEQVNKAGLHNSHELKQYKLGDEDATLDHPVSPAYARKLVHAYLACVSYVDAQVGKVLRALEDAGMAEHTMVVVWGDHGWHLGEQCVWGKHTIFEVALNSVLMIRLPEESQGQICDRVVSSTDIYPTLADWCQIEMDYAVDGQSLIPLLKNRNDHNWKNVAYSYFKNGVTVRTPRYRLTRYNRKAEPTIELYDYKNDPYETRNIAVERPDVVKKLMPLLKKGDTGIFNTNEVWK